MSLCLEWMKGNLRDEVEHIKYEKNICASARCYRIWVGIFTSAHVPETVSTAFPFPIFFPEGWKGGRGGEGRGAVHR